MEKITSPEMLNYFKSINNTVKKCYVVANKARKLGLDPEDEVCIPVAKNMAERVVGLISVVAPQISGTKIPERILELEKQYGQLDWRVAFTIAEEVAKEQYCKFEDKKEAMEIGIRIGFSYITLGVVSAPLEGFIELNIKKRKDGKEYFSVQFAGPIRAAGGTGASVSVLLADYIRIKMGYSPYDPEEAEVNRYTSEVHDYHDRVTNLQYHPSDKELKFLISHLPVEVGGEPTERIEVSNYKDLPRIETNLIRGGVALVLAEGLSQKAPKLWKKLVKWGKDFGMEHWSFLEEFIKIKEEIHAGGDKKKENTGEKEEKRIKPNNTFIMDLVAGRPILTHPMATGGFRLRYGRGRTCGMYAVGMNPSTMVVTNDFLAVGTQMKVERPRKGASVTVCDTVEGPVVRLKDGSVVYLNSEDAAKEINKEIDEVLFLGDIMFAYGDFSESGHDLCPAGYCPEWWAQEAEKAINNLFSEEPLKKAAQKLKIEEKELREIIEKPLEYQPRWKEITTLSKELKIPLHPDYTFYWKLISGSEVLTLREWLQEGKIKIDEKGIKKIILPLYKDQETHQRSKKILEELGAPHKVIGKENIVLERKEANILALCFNFSNQKELQENKLASKDGENKDGLETINGLCKVSQRDKAGTFIGARMGRPEKGKTRALKGSPQVMFPVGEEGDRLRCFQSALKAGKVNSTFPTFYCLKCESNTVYRSCENCGEKTEQRYYCRFCGDLDKEECRHGKANTYKTQDIDIKHYFNKAKEIIGERLHPDLIKGVKGTSNKDHLVEHLSKGILRAKHGIYVNKDGTTRYDATELPLTHFKPKEIRTSIEKLKTIGYRKDIYGKDLVEVNQILELKPQDVVLPGFDSLESSAAKVLSGVANFVDELLVKLYKLKPYFNLKKPEDLVGQLVIGLAPHISAGIIGRIIGFSETQTLLAHPMYHAAMRRDCDGDEACVMLLMDALLNFSRQYLPERRGAKSVTPDTLIYYSKNGEINTEKIGNLIDDLLIKNKELIRKDEDYEILELNDYKTISFDKKSKKVGEFPITKFIRHSSPEYVYEVITSHGKINVTGDHSVFITNGKNIEEIEVRSLKEQDNLITLGKINLPAKKTVPIDLISLLGDKVYVKLNKGIQIKNSEKLRKKYGNNYYRYISGDRRAPISFILEAKLLNNIKKICLKQGEEIPRYLNINESLVTISSYLISEGYLRNNRSAEIVNTDKEIINEVVAALENILQRKVKIGWDNRVGRKRCARIRLPNVLREALIALGHCAVKSEEKHLPSFIFNLNDTLKTLFLKCYEKGDGHNYKHKNFVMFYSKSEYLAAEISLLAHSLNKKTSINKGTRCLQILSSDYNNTDPWWPLADFTKDIYRALRKEGFSKNEIHNKTSNYYNIKRKRTASKFRIKELIDLLKHKDNIKLKKTFEKIYTSDIRVERVRKINKVKSKFKYVYDLEVPEHQNFLCGPHPIFAHNTMDAPLVLTSTIYPSEVDDQVLDMDTAWKYPLEFYEATLEMKKPWDVKVEQLSKRLGTPQQYEGMGFTHDTNNFNKGPLCSAYKTLPTMADKLIGQMELARKIRAVDMDDVAKLVIQKHFLKDIKGNLRKFSMQTFRCVKCNTKYRRPPLSGNCTACPNGKLIFTISEGSVVKYLGHSLRLSEEYDFSPYLKQTIQILQMDVNNVFGKEKEKQAGLGDFMG